MNTSAMRNVAMLGVVLTVGSACAALAQPGELTPETEVKLHMVERLQSGAAREGERINFRVDSDVQDSAGNVLIRGGAAAYGTVKKSQRSGAWGKRGHLDISIDYTTAVDGQRVPPRGQNGAGGRRGGTTAWATALFVAPAGAL